MWDLSVSLLCVSTYICSHFFFLFFPPKFTSWGIYLTCSLSDVQPSVLVLFVGDVLYHTSALLWPLAIGVSERSELLREHVTLLEQPQRNCTLKAQSRKTIAGLWRFGETP